MLRLSRLFLRLGFVLILAFLMVVLPVSWKHMKAGRILNEIRAERWSSVNFEKAKEISEKYGGHPGLFGREGLPCNADSCRFDIVVSNFPMDYLHLAPKTSFDVSIHVQSNRVTAVSSDLLSRILGGSPAGPAPLGADVVENIGQTDPSAPAFLWNINTDTVAGASTINVALNPSATAEQRRAAYNFNLGCLTKLGGCKSPGDFLPRRAVK
ncbi:MAG TPA: hypothetical protein VMG31_06520 [Verrucomicrobiae bacterium]|nr:hypothetical protein [Verrucomicrobiae bacterium]